MITNIIDQLVRDEGFRPAPYKDTRGFSTVGIGHNLDAHPLPSEVYPMTLERAKDLLAWDLQGITTKLYHDLPWVPSLLDVYKGVLQNMAYNIGAAGEEAFHHMLADIQAGNYVKASVDGAQSAWYNEVGDRAKRLMTQLSTGEWQ